ncbi:MAG: DUF2029 domain-containing protein [Chloroflexi bacterium]|nr:DUF2029 domain-containing protein [Chloroflexota bacterium]
MFATRVRTTSSLAAVLDAAVPGFRALAPYALLAIVGVELALLTAFLPGTVDRSLHGPTADFHNLYGPAHNRELPGLYSPFLVVLLYPIALLPEMDAYRVFFGLNVACLVAVALVMQGGVRSFEAKAAVALAPVALPQVHWALRLGHLTPIIALLLIASLMLLQTRPRHAAALLALVSIKPQYLIAPVLFLFWKRRFRLVAIVIATSALLAGLGFAVIGPDSVRQFVAYYLDWGPNSTDNLLPVQQSWMISWTGFQLSLGQPANPLLTLDLVILSLGVALFAWARTAGAASAAVTGLMLIPLTPYAQFYDGALVLVAIALILRTDTPVMVRGALSAALYLAAVATQASIPFPVKDVLGPAHTNGIYWLAPALVLSAATFAIFTVRASNPKEGAPW